MFLLGAVQATGVYKDGVAEIKTQDCDANNGIQYMPRLVECRCLVTYPLIEILNRLGGDRSGLLVVILYCVLSGDLSHRRPA